MKNNLGNKEIFAANLQRFMDKKGIDRQTLSDAIGVPYTTVRDWTKGNTYPRIDKIELMANYFGVTKADLIEAPQEDDLQIDYAYLSLAKDAQDKGIAPEDIRKAIEFLEDIKKGRV